MKNIMSVTALMLLIVSCVEYEDTSMLETEVSYSYPITVSVSSPYCLPAARSSFTDEQMNRLNDLNIFIYHGGRLLEEHGGYFSDMSSLMLSFPPGTDGFNIYMVGNVGKVEAPEREEEIGKLSHILDSYDGLRLNGAPVAESFPDYRKGTLAHFTLRRLVGQYNISMKTSATGAEYLVKDVRMHNCALDVYPFSSSTKASVFARTVGGASGPCGDMLTEEDISKLNDGQTVSLYFVENLQGVLLPGNTDRKKKIPSALPESVAGSCTYMEVTADVTTPAAKYTDARYRFYLGQDQTTDFSIRRNTLYDVVLDFSQNMVCEEEWRIEADEPEVADVRLTKNQLHISPYRNDVIYVYSPSRNIDEVADIEFDMLGLGGVAAGVKAVRTLVDYEGYRAYRFSVGLDNGFTSLKTHPLGSAPSFQTYQAVVRSRETYNNDPVISRDLQVNYSGSIYPLLLKLEKQPGSKAYSIALRGHNPFGYELTVSAVYVYNGKVASTVPVTVTDLSEKPVYAGVLEEGVTPGNISGIHFRIEGLPSYDQYKALCGPGSDMYPEKFTDMPDNSECDITYEYKSGTWMPVLSGENLSFSKGVRFECLGTSGTVYFSNKDEYGYGIDSPQAGGYGNASRLGGFYILNGGMAYKQVTMQEDAMVKYPKKAWRGVDVYLYGPGRDLFFENRTGGAIDNVHHMRFRYTTWKNLLGKLKSQQEEQKYEGQLYMTINGMTSWPGGTNEPLGYFSDAY